MMIKLIYLMAYYLGDVFRTICLMDCIIFLTKLIFLTYELFFI
jgi:hypothetical protein